MYPLIHFLNNTEIELGQKKYETDNKHALNGARESLKNHHIPCLMPNQFKLSFFFIKSTPIQVSLDKRGHNNVTNFISNACSYGTKRKKRCIKPQMGTDLNWMLILYLQGWDVLFKDLIITEVK